MSRPTDVIDAHIPSMTDEDEMAISELIDLDGYGYTIENDDVAGLAIRTCACGVSIDGFYEYATHLNVELLKAGF